MRAGKRRRDSTLLGWLGGDDRAAVQFLKPHPPILLDCGGKPCTLGPFRPGDIALLPARLAEDLARRGVARRFSIAA
jgi:hypothetical protein